VTALINEDITGLQLMRLLYYSLMTIWLFRLEMVLCDCGPQSKIVIRCNGSLRRIHFIILCTTSFCFSAVSVGETPECNQFGPHTYQATSFESSLRFFDGWCRKKDLTKPADITKIDFLISVSWASMRVSSVSC
jgi:hypothetical protein